MPTAKKKFLRSDFFKIGGSVLVTLLVVYLFNSILNFDQDDPISKDHRITTTEMIDYYSQYTNAERIPIWYDLGQGQREGKLEGFPIATAELEEIIHNNKYSGFLGHDIKPDTILFYLGQQGTSTYRGKTRPNMRLIAIGIKNKKLLIPDSRDDWGNLNKSSIFDKALPCPGPGCPVKTPRELLN